MDRAAAFAKAVGLEHVADKRIGEDGGRTFDVERAICSGCAADGGVEGDVDRFCAASDRVIEGIFGVTRAGRIRLQGDESAAVVCTVGLVDIADKRVAEYRARTDADIA